MFPSGNDSGFAGFSNNNSQQTIPASGLLQYPQTLDTPVAIPSQMVANNVLLPPNHEQYQRYMQMQNVQQQTQQFSSLTQQPGYYQTKQNVQHTRTQPPSDEESEDVSNENPWQVVRGVKRKKTSTTQTLQHENVNLQNRYTPLAQEENLATNIDEATKSIPKPPPIFVYGVVNFPQMIQKIHNIIEAGQYTTRSMANNTIKINCTTPDIYRKLVKYLKENNIVYHTYQPKEERAFRVAIKYLHHTMDVKEITDDITSQGHKVRNIINAKQRRTKEPLNLFFVDLEPADNNKDIYKIRRILNSCVQIEPPRKDKNIIQCTRCQLYGHTKTYCNGPFRCVKCGEPHDTASCKKSSKTPATCALCGGPHPANYKGCDYYYRLYKGRDFNNSTHQRAVINTNTTYLPPTAPPTPRHQITYANAVNNNTHNTSNERSTNESISKVLAKFLEDFKILFNQLIQQNSMVLNMLSMLIGKKNG